MKISLTSSSPMWFLGDPKNLLVSLSYSHPGPVDIDFNSLDRNYQQKILLAVKNEVLESDVPFEDMYKVWAKDMVVAQKAAETERAPTSAEIQLQQRMELEMKRKMKEDLFQERCNSILRSGVSAVVGALSDEKEDPRLARNLLQLEKAGKNRKTVIKHLIAKIKQIENKIVMRINKDVKEQLEASSPKRTRAVDIPGSETDEYSVIESDFKTVVLTPEELISAGARSKR